MKCNVQKNPWELFNNLQNFCKQTVYALHIIQMLLMYANIPSSYVCNA